LPASAPSPPPPPPLFPYTTLFRSHRGRRRVMTADAANVGSAAPTPPTLLPGSGLGALRLARLWIRFRLRFLWNGMRARGRGRFPDRKSTRLNSSHLGISYAVFCLK